MSDVHLRELERRAAVGDQDAHRALQAARCRTGEHEGVFEFRYDEDIGVRRFWLCGACDLRVDEGLATTAEGLAFFNNLGYGTED